MIRNLLHDHELCIQQLRKDADTAEELGDMLTNDFLISKAHGHEKMAWFLRAHIEHATR
jgi:DNA-binding ferritin-like protein